MTGMLPLGKWRRLSQVAGDTGAFSILAMDHRGPLRRALVKLDPNLNSDESLSTLKTDIIQALAPESTAVLLDPETGLRPCLADLSLPGNRGLIVASDTGSTGDPARLETHLVEGWSIEKTLATGASGVKLLVYFHPEAPNAGEVIECVRGIGTQCSQHNLPFFLEPLSFCPQSPGTPLSSAARREVVMESARQLVPLGVDVLKAEFPINHSDCPDEAVWQSACQELSSVCPVPWVLLSAGVSFEVFLRQARIACEAGASGVMAGRAVWKEAVTHRVDQRRQFLNQKARMRMRQLTSLCEALGRPFPEIYKLEPADRPISD